VRWSSSIVVLALLACGGDTARTDARPTDTTPVDSAPADTTPPPDDTSMGVDTAVPASCDAGSPLGLSQCVDGARYQTDLELIAAPRPPGSAHWQVVQDLCADRLASLGFEVERHTYATGVNVIGVRTGNSEPGRQVLVAAHYDHIDGCAGADDNATGTAAALESARVLAMAGFPHTLVVACWDEEERGLIGSGAYADRARAADDDIVVYYNYEMIGYVDDTPGSQSFPAGFDLLFPEAARELEANENRGDFLALIADETASDAVSLLDRYGEALGLPTISIVLTTDLLTVPLLGDLRRSDHSRFWDQAYPAIMLTDTSEFRYDAYHCRSGPDDVGNLDQGFTTRVIQTTVAAAAASLGL